MTQLEAARKGTITPEMCRVAERENVTPESIRDEGQELLRQRAGANS